MHTYSDPQARASDPQARTQEYAVLVSQDDAVLVLLLSRVG